MHYSLCLSQNSSICITTIFYVFKAERVFLTLILNMLDGHKKKRRVDLLHAYRYIYCFVCYFMAILDRYRQRNVFQLRRILLRLFSIFSFCEFSQKGGRCSCYLTPTATMIDALIFVAAFVVTISLTFILVKVIKH